MTKRTVVMRVVRATASSYTSFLVPAVKVYGSVLRPWGGIP